MAGGVALSHHCIISLGDAVPCSAVDDRSTEGRGVAVEAAAGELNQSLHMRTMNVHFFFLFFCLLFVPFFEKKKKKKKNEPSG